MTAPLWLDTSLALRRKCMSSSAVIEEIDQIVARLARAGWKEREVVRDELLALGRAAADPATVRDHLEEVKGALQLEVRWEIEEVIEALTPEPEAPEEEPEEEVEEAEDDPNRQLTAADLTLVYHDPRGFMLHKTKTGSRWLATEVDSRTGQPMTYELQEQEADQLKQRLTGSPYWVLGSGANSGA